MEILDTSGIFTIANYMGIFPRINLDAVLLPTNAENLLSIEAMGCNIAKVMIHVRGAFS